MLLSVRQTRSLQTILKQFSFRRYTSANTWDGYCVEIVRKHDYESFLSGLLIPKEYRSAYFAINAFNVEIATIKDQIPRNNTLAGKIRFQFWKDVLHQIYFDKKLSPSINQPVAQALEYYILKHNLTLRWFERSLEARFQDMLKPGEFTSMDDLENYAEYSHSSILYLLLETMEVKNETAEYAASHVGVCKGIVTLLRGYSHHASQGICYFPTQIMLKHGLLPHLAIRLPTSTIDRESHRNVVNDIASQAYAHLAKARELKKSIPVNAIYAFFGAATSSAYLSALFQADFDIQTADQQQSSSYYTVLVQLQLLILKLCKKF